MSSFSDRIAAKAQERHWWILLVLCTSTFLVVLDNSILNTAIPRMVTELGASNREIQWILDAYTVVFACFLITAGAMGDRFGRKLILQVGLVVFGLGSLLAALSGNASELIMTRAFQGVGGAMVMPSTLSVIAFLFPTAERGRAIGVWAASAAFGGLTGPLIGGVLLKHFYWGSVFLVNLPVIAVTVTLGWWMIPESKNPATPRLDPVGAVLSIATFSALLYAVIEAPERGWTEPATLSVFAVGLVFGLVFAWWELRSPEPMLDLRLFGNPRFSMGAAAITMSFMAIFGSMFIIGQYLQLVRGFTPLEAGVRLVAFAGPAVIVSLLVARVTRWLGTKITVATGLLLIIVAMGLFQTFEEGSAYFPTLFVPMVVASVASALIMQPATESIMGSLPVSQAGVGSAINSATRQVGIAIGVAVIGSVFNSVYVSRLTDRLEGRVGAETLREAEHGLGDALRVASSVGGDTGAFIARAAKQSFLDGFHTGPLVSAGLAFLTAVAALRWLPARARTEDVDAQEAEFAAAWTTVQTPTEVAARPAVEAPAP